MGITGAASLREDTMKSIAFMFPHAIMRQVQFDDEPPQPNNVMRSRHDHTLQQFVDLMLNGLPMYTDMCN
jgi:hypothetical protein